MTRMPLYISYGMPKSGSTLAFELTRTMLELSGTPQTRIADDITDASNFVLKLDGPALLKLSEDAAGSNGPRVIKTHSRLFPKVENSLKKGLLTGQAVCRDPRDIALSMLDAAKEGRAWGNDANGPFRTVADTVKRLHACVGTFEKWARMPNVMPIHYERLAFDTESVAAEIASQLGISVDIRKAIEIATGSKFTQLNQGVSQRWKSQMAPADAKRLEIEFKDYIGTYCHDVPAAPKLRKPSTGFFSKWLPRRS